MEKFINELGKRRRHLAFLMMPPGRARQRGAGQCQQDGLMVVLQFLLQKFRVDASWPLISQLSRRHEYNDLTTRTSYHMFEGDLVRP